MPSSERQITTASGSTIKKRDINSPEAMSGT
jgi:hypothetical protein